jgi:hypothetical protein
MKSKLTTDTTKKPTPSSAANCSALHEARDDECDHKLAAFEEAARHLEEIAEDLERGMEKTCLIKVAASIRSTGRLAYGHPLAEPNDQAHLQPPRRKTP